MQFPIQQFLLYGNKAMKQGFTLIELIVVIGIIVITLPVTFSLFFVNFQAQTKVYILQEVKRNGDYALNVIESLIKQRAYAIYTDQALTAEVCSTKSGTNTNTSYTGALYFKDKDGKYFNFAISGNKIASYSAIINPNPYNLTNQKVIVSGFTTSCNRTQTFSPPLVSISFKIDQASGTRYEEVASLSYQTKIKLRSY